MGPVMRGRRERVGVGLASGSLAGEGEEDVVEAGPADLGRDHRRVRRTRALLRAALVALIRERGYDRITVQDILDRADVGRSTFYAHYRDKEDLLLSGFEDIRAALAAELAASEHEHAKTAGKVELLQPLLVVFQHVEAYRDSWGPMTRKGGTEVITRILRQSVADLTRAHLQARFPPAKDDEAQLEAITHYVVGACMGLLIWWLDNDIPDTAENLHSTFQQLATQGLERFMTTR